MARRSSESFILSACALMLVAAGCGGGAGAEPRVRAAQPTTTTTTTTATTAVTAPPTTAATTTTVPALPGDDIVGAPRAPAAPVVSAAPVAPRRSGPSGPEPASLTVTGQIEIPKIGLNHTTYEGISLKFIDHGPSHWPGTPMPGQAGNTVFAGHRVTNTRPFFDIDRIAVGDQVSFTNPSGRYVYEVTETLVVAANAIWIADPTPGTTFTIFGCHPKGSARQRYVVKGKLVTSAGAAPAPGAPAPAGSAPGAGGTPAPTTQPPACLLCGLLGK